MARRLIFKENGLNESGASPNGLRFLGYNGTTISEKFGATVSAIGGTGGSQNLIITTTRSEVVISASNSTLEPGVLYHITDAHNDLYGGTEIVLQAISSNELDVRGMGKFYNPNYTSATGSNVWNNINWFRASGINGTFSRSENITANNGAVAQVKGLVNLPNPTPGDYTFFTVTSGTWSTATSITGNLTGATSSISDVTVQSYTIGQKVIWGGKVWSNLTGNRGSSIDKYSLDGTNWSAVSYNETDYTVEWDEITYDFSNNFISSRKDKNQNYVEQSYINYNNETGYYSIKDFQWGNATKVYGNHVKDSLCEIVNFKGKQLIGCSFLDSWIYDIEFGYGLQMYTCKFDTYTFFNDCFFFAVGSSGGGYSPLFSMYYLTLKNSSFIDSSEFMNNGQITACESSNGGISRCSINQFNMYDFNFNAGSFLNCLRLVNSTNSSSLFTWSSLTGTELRFSPSTTSATDIYKDKNLKGVHSFGTQDSANLWITITKSSTILWAGASNNPSKQILRKADGNWVVSSLTSGGTFSVVDINS